MIYKYRHMCAIIVAYAMLRNVGGVRPQPFSIHASRLKCSNHWAWAKNVLKWNPALRFVY